jgi:hypothetical protein
MRRSDRDGNRLVPWENAGILALRPSIVAVSEYPHLVLPQEALSKKQRLGTYEWRIRRKKGRPA